MDICRTIRESPHYSELFSWKICHIPRTHCWGIYAHTVFSDHSLFCTRYQFSPLSPLPHMYSLGICREQCPCPCTIYEYCLVFYGTFPQKWTKNTITEGRMRTDHKIHLWDRESIWGWSEMSQQSPKTVKPQKSLKKILTNVRIFLDSLLTVLIIFYPWCNSWEWNIHSHVASRKPRLTMSPAQGCGKIVEKNTDQMHERRENYWQV